MLSIFRNSFHTKLVCYCQWGLAWVVKMRHCSPPHPGSNPAFDMLAPRGPIASARSRICGRGQLRFLGDFDWIRFSPVTTTKPRIDSTRPQVKFLPLTGSISKKYTYIVCYHCQKYDSTEFTFPSTPPRMTSQLIPIVLDDTKTFPSAMLWSICLLPFPERAYSAHRCLQHGLSLKQNDNKKRYYLLLNEILDSLPFR